MGSMRDPEEGVTAAGLIRTGARRARVPRPFEPIVAAAINAIDALGDDAVELHLYGSVATGMAINGSSDIDLIAIGVSDDWAHRTSARLSKQFADVSRSVDIGAAMPSDYHGETDEAYGNQVFLRHYCISLAGPDAIRSTSSFPGDRRAARGFNGDTGRLLQRWKTGVEPRRAARKSLLAAAGVISVRDHTWTTDRATAAHRWTELEPQHADAAQRLLAWAEGAAAVSDAELAAALSPTGVITAIAHRFATDVGLWGHVSD